jgi:DNA (cytosine-5)-methyltransferase 1
MRVLDLFCGEGGASQGYADAGFTVVGVDSNPAAISRYPFSAFAGDWRDGLRYWLDRVQVDLIHASPPCQRYSRTARLHPGIDYPDLIAPVRGILMETEIPWVIENVPEAPLLEPVYLCGSMFQLHGFWKGEYVGLDRCRGFEATFPLVAPLDCSCGDVRTVPVFGHGCPSNRPWFKGPGFADLTRQVMGIDWMSRDGLTEAIPPAYATHAGYSFQIHKGEMINVPDRCSADRHEDVLDHVC